jgi:hypothetical protein
LMGQLNSTGSVYEAELAQEGEGEARGFKVSLVHENPEPRRNSHCQCSENEKLV